MDSYTLLADPTAGGRQTAVLKLDGSPIQMRADALAADEDLLFVDLWLGSAVEHLGLVVDKDWQLPARAQNHDRELALADVRAQLAALDYPLLTGDGRRLYADHVDGRRTSVLKDKAGVWELRAKLLVDEDGTMFVQLRLWYSQRGFMHAVLRSDGVLVATTTGGTDKDTFERLRGELGRRDIALD